MPEGNRAATGCAPLVLRLMLAVTFLWAGAGKVFKDGEFAGADAAALANMGLALTPTREVITPSKPPAPGAAAPPASTSPAVTPDRPISLPPDPKKKPEPGRSNKPSRPADRDGPAVGDAGGTGNQLPVAAAVQTAPVAVSGKYKAEDFPRAVNAPRLYSLAVLMKGAGTARTNETGKALSPYWPSWLSEGATPLYLAWATAMTELLAGAMLLVGLITRLAALAICGVMLGAIWLTQLGPAIQSGDTFLGVLPAHAWWDPKPWTPLLWQLSLLTSAFALVLLGAGAASVDGGSARKVEAPKPEKHPRPV